MFVEDLQEEFYKVVSGKRLLVLVNCDVDAICACKILLSLFRCDNTLYSIVPVEGVQDLVESYNKHCEQIKYVLLINCGGTIDIIDTLQPEEDVTIFIVDSHKPTDVSNVYSSEQVRLLGKQDEDENVPEFDQIFRDSESEGEDEEAGENEEEEEEEEEGQPSKRMRLAEEEIVKRRERRLWEENRKTLMFEYSQFSYYGRSSAMIVFELVWHLGKDNVDSLWWAIVGVTNQVVLGLCLDQRYLNELSVLQLHMSRLVSNDDGNEERQVYKLPTTKITSQKDLRLVLYRHWTVEASLRHSMPTAIKLKLWTIKGERRLRQLLAEIGLPLNSSKQNFSAMDITLRKDFFSMMEKVSSTYELNDLIYPSFTLTYGFRWCYQSSDYVYALLGLLDTSRERSRSDCFADALDCLSRNRNKLFEDGLSRSKNLLICIYRQLQSLIDMKLIASAGPFLYFVLQEGCVDWRVFSNPDILFMLARVALRAHHTLSRTKRTAFLPLLASSTSYPDRQNSIVLGIPPVTETVPRNFFGQAFTQAAETIDADQVLNYFDSAIIKIKTEDRPKFFDALSEILS